MWEIAWDGWEGCMGSVFGRVASKHVLFFCSRGVFFLDVGAGLGRGEGRGGEGRENVQGKYLGGRVLLVVVAREMGIEGMVGLEMRWIIMARSL
jgi:hypothetical protein